MKRTAWKLLGAAGVVGAWRRRHRFSIPILTAHGIASAENLGSWAPLWNRVDVDHLEHVLGILSQHYTFIALSEAISIIAGEAPPRENVMVLTFDDGYLNNYSIALPVLHRLGIPATLYVCPGIMASRKRFWIDRIDYAIQKIPMGKRQINVAGRSIIFNTTSRQRLIAAYKELRQTLKAEFVDDFDQQIDEFATQLEELAGCSVLDAGDADPWSGIMSWDQAREALTMQCEIESHTVDHVRLTLVDRSTVDEQLLSSRQQVSEKTRRPCQSIAYPNGDHSPDVRAAARNAGYTSGLTCDPGINAPGDDLFALRRINFPAAKVPEQILGVASGFRHAIGGLFQNARN